MIAATSSTIMTFVMSGIAIVIGVGCMISMLIGNDDDDNDE